MLLIEAFRWAPSAANFQPWKLLIIQQLENKKKVIASYPRTWIESAPMFFIVCGDHRFSWKRDDGKDYADIDLAIATEHLVLQATEVGLATCWVCNFNKQKLISYFNFPEYLEPIAIVPVGYPTDKSDSARISSKRKNISEFIYWEELDL